MIVVTAPTSKIGRRVVEHLLAADEPTRVVVRDPQRLASAVRERVEIVAGSHRDVAVVEEAFAGADAVFWLMPADLRATDAVSSYVDSSRAGARAIAEHGVEHVVGVSALGRGTPAAGRAGNVTGSLAMDDLFATVTSYRALANATFMDNTLREVPSILTDGSISGTLDPEVAAPLVATRDIASAAAHLLLDRRWTGFAEVPLLGPEDLSGREMAGIVAEVLELPVRYRQVTAGSVEEGLLHLGVSAGMARAVADMARAKADGLDQAVRTSDTSTPTTYHQWCTDVLRPAVDAARRDRDGLS